MPSVINLDEVKAAATTARTEEVKKAVAKKYAVINKRKGQLAAHNAAFDKKVGEFEEAIETAENNEQILSVLQQFKFPASSICLTVKQDD